MAGQQDAAGAPSHVDLRHPTSQCVCEHHLTVQVFVRACVCARVCVCVHVFYCSVLVATDG